MIFTKNIMVGLMFMSSINRCVLFVMMACSYSHASQEKHVLDSVIISSIPESGMMVSNNRVNYMKRYHVRVLNTSSETVSLKNGCYYASNFSGTIKIKPKIFSPELSGDIISGPNGKPLEGEMEFISKNKDVYGTVYVSWSSDCQ